MKKRDVGMAKHFSNKYGNKGWAFDYPVSAIWNQFLFCQDACQCLMLHPYIPTSMPQEQAAKTNMMGSKMLGRALDPRANSTWLSKLTEWNQK